MRFLILPFLFGAPQSVLDVQPAPQSVVSPANDANAVYAEAVRNGSFIVWFDERPVLADDLIEWRGATGVITISGPYHGGRHITYVTLQQATFSEVKSTLEASKAWWDAERQVKPIAASPFRTWPLPSAAHDSQLGRGPWPEGLDFDDKMQRYKRAAFTQEIAVTNGRDRITPVPRLNLPDARWHQSGGMLGIKEFRSDLYRYLPDDPKVWVGDIAVWNGSNFQNNRGWKVEYPNGSKFMDVLSTEGGKVFEVRQRKKESGKWQSSVVFEDTKSRPRGYAGLTVSCNSCHREAGSGGYAVGLVPGGDGVLSVGFTALEK